MPMALIEIVKKYTKEEEVGLIEAINSAILDAFKVSPEAINVRLLVHELHRVLVPPNTNPELYTIVSIDCFKGRSLDIKRHLYSKIVENLFKLGVPKDHVKIVIRESEKENWGILGGQPGSDVDLGYKVNT